MTSVHCIKIRTSLGQPGFTQRFLLLHSSPTFSRALLNIFSAFGFLCVLWTYQILLLLQSSDQFLLTLSLYCIVNFCSSFCDAFWLKFFKVPREDISCLILILFHRSEGLKQTSFTKVWVLYLVFFPLVYHIHAKFSLVHYCLNTGQSLVASVKSVFSLSAIHLMAAKSLILCDCSLSLTWIKKGMLLRTLLNVIVLNVTDMQSCFLI